MQETNFKYEIVIIEDCSTDSTRDIVVDFQKRYPEIIRLILSEKNKNDNANFITAWKTSRGQYIAIVDGDDYWTSPHKLQKQVNFLDTHPECAFCFHNVTMVHEGGNQAPWPYFLNQGEIATLEDLLARDFIPGCSPMFRKGLFTEFPDWFYSDKYADTALKILNAEHGKIGYIDELMGVYRIHNGGIWSSLSKTKQLEVQIEQCKEINAHLNFKYRHILGPRIAELKAKLIWQKKGSSYQQLIQRIREVVSTALLPDATVVVFGKGNDEALELEGRQVCQFGATSGLEQLFAQGSQGCQVVPWISAGMIYEFYLYSGTDHAKQIARTRVMSSNETSHKAISIPDMRSGEAFIVAASNPVPIAGGSGTTTISWSTGDLSEGQVYVLSDQMTAYYYPANNAEALAHLKALQAKGVQFLLFPSTALWWLERYPEFKQHLVSRHRMVAYREDACLIFSLQESETGQWR